MAKRSIVPFGPQHPVLPEPVHLDLILEDETVVGAVPSIGFIHRGLEKLVEKRDFKQYVYIAERVCGICSCGHGLGYCEAVEQVMGIEVPDRARYLRTIWVEMSRVHSHLLWLGLLADAMGFESLYMESWRLREKILDMFDETTGGRIIHSVNCVGGVQKDMDSTMLQHILQAIDDIRGEMKPAMRAYYGLDVKSSKVPPLMTEQDLLQWGEKIINGEQERLRNRDGNPIYCPSIALVKVNYENFKENYLRQKQYQSNSARESGNVAQFRTEADNLILELWNEVEEHFASLTDEEERRRRCEAYGLVYVFRRGEEERIRQRKEVERITLKLF